MLSCPVEDMLMSEWPSWEEGPPHELFKRLRDECPIHWTDKITEWPDEAGYWSVTKADDIHTVSKDWKTYSSERGGITALTHSIMPLEIQQGMFIAMDPPKHDRLKALFQRGFTPKRIAEHEDEIREITHSACSTASKTGRRRTSSNPSLSRSSRESSEASWASTRKTTRSGRAS